MAFLVYIIIMVTMLIIADITRPVPASPKKPGLGDFEFPTADASRKVPVIWGKPLLRGANVTWYGALRITKIKKTVKGVFSDKSYTAGYKYNVGMHLAFCVGNGDVKLLRLTAGDEEFFSSAAGVSGGTYTVNKPDLFGGEDSGGGISGKFDWCPGGQGQGQNDYLRNTVSSRVPAYRSTARLVWRGGYVGTSKYIKEWAAQCQRLPLSLGSGYHDIEGEANIAEVLYEMLTEKIWGLGASSLDINMPSFLAAAKTLYDEKLGISLVWDGSKALRAVADDLLAHIDGLLFVNVLTGKWELSLNRQPTEAELTNLPTFDETMIQELESFSRPSLDETTNEVNVIWTEEGETTQWPAKAQDLGLFQVHDKQYVSVDVTYQGITSYELAQRLATRDLRTLSYPLVKTSFKSNRAPYTMKPGSRFKFSWAPLEVEEIVMRVIGVDYGTLDDNVIAIDAVQDVFALGTGLYQGGGSGGWIPPSRTPLPPSVYRLDFTPYWLMKVDPNIVNPESAVPMVMVESPSNTHISYDLEYSDPSTGGTMAPGDQSNPFTPTAVLMHDYLETSGTDSSATLIFNQLTSASEIEVATLSEIQYLGQGLVVIESEWMAFTGVTERSDGSWAATTVYRGLMDSVIARHLAGSKVWFVGMGVGRTPTEIYPFAAGTYRAKLISRAMGGLLDDSAAPIVSITTNGTTTNARPLYPYPPRDLSINNSRAPATVANGPLVVNWKFSNRLSQDYIYLQETTAEQQLEPGTVFRAQLFNDESTLLASSPDLVTTGYTFNPAEGLPASGYVQVQTVKPGVGVGQKATLWFGLSVDYASTADAAPQRFLDQSGPWQFWRMSD